MFSIAFNPRLAKWQVRMKKFGLVWIPIKDAEFQTIMQARQFVQQIGLSEHYDEQVYKGFYKRLGVQGVR